MIKAIGLSLNRWEPWNGVRAVRTGAIDAVQVIYNIFDQNPEDELFPACDEMNVAVIARVPLMMADTRLTGTSISRASWFWLIPMGRRNSSRRISPGEIGSRS